jgi:hypothetical protein
MATDNKDFPSGASIYTGRGGSSTIQINEYPVRAAYNTLIPKGCFLIINQTTGGVEIFDGTGHGSLLIGRAAQSVAASTVDTTVQVNDAPDQLYEMQLDGADIVTDAAAWFRHFGLTNATASNSVTLRSTCELAGAGAQDAVGANNPLMSVAVATGVENDITGATGFARLVVKIAPDAHFFTAN